MSLYVFVIDPELRAKYRTHLETRRSTDSGFDVLCPAYPLDQGYASKLNLGIHCAATTDFGTSAPYLLLARSSTSLTPLRLANQIGLADMGYRGELIARVDVLSPYTIESGQRLFQIVQHNWMPWDSIHIVDSLEELPAAPDTRGAGGFGSTGQ